MRKIVNLDYCFNLAMHELQRLTVGRQVKRSAKYRMATNQLPDSLPHCFHLLRYFDMKTEHIVIDSRLGIEFTVKEHAGLKPAERIGIFHVIGQQPKIFFSNEGKG